MALVIIIPPWYLVTQRPRHRLENARNIPLSGHRRTRQHFLRRAGMSATGPDGPALACEHQEVPESTDVLKPDEENIVVFLYSTCPTLELPVCRTSSCFATARCLGCDDAERPGHGVGLRTSERFNAFSPGDHCHVYNRAQWYFHDSV